MKIGKVKVTLHFRNGGSMTFKCIEFQITKSIDGGLFIGHYYQP